VSVSQRPPPKHVQPPGPHTKFLTVPLRAPTGRRLRCRVTIADKGYDADHLCDRIAQTGGQPVIPPKRNRTFKRPYDAELYKERNVIERFFNKLEQFRRVATRYDKLLTNFMGFVKLAAIAIWLK
jgi:putative transposase